jgi:hypothetical protein
MVGGWRVTGGVSGVADGDNWLSQGARIHFRSAATAQWQSLALADDDAYDAIPRQLIPKHATRYPNP